MRRDLGEIDHTRNQRGDDAGIEQQTEHLTPTPLVDADGGNAVDEKEQIHGDEEERHVDDCLIAVDPLYERQPQKERVVEPE